MNGADDDARTRQVDRRTWLGSKISRRSVLTTTPLAAVGGWALVACTPDRQPGPSAAQQDVSAPLRPPQPPEEVPQALRFFTEEEARTVEAVTSRLVPGTDEDPGAVQAGVVRYIDTKLAQHEAFAEPTYHEPPFANQTTNGAPGIPVDEDELYRYGFQSHLNHREIYHLGVPAVDRYAQTRFGSLFHELPEERQDDVLRVLEGVQQRQEAEEDAASDPSQGSEAGEEADEGNGAIPANLLDQAEEVFDQLDPGLFFSTLRTDTIEGMFADPLYGGNAGMVGWALIGYPGAQRSYSPKEMLHGADRQPQPMHQLTAMNPDRPGGGRPALEQHEHLGPAH